MSGYQNNYKQVTNYLHFTNLLQVSSWWLFGNPVFFIVCGQHDSWINSLHKMLTRNCNKIWIKGQFHTWIHYQNDMGMHNLILLHIHIIIYYIGTQLPLKYGYSVEKNMDTILKWHGDKKASLIIWYITNIHSFKLHWDTVVYLNMAAG